MALLSLDPKISIRHPDLQQAVVFRMRICCLEDLFIEARCICRPLALIPCITSQSIRFPRAQLVALPSNAHRTQSLLPAASAAVPALTRGFAAGAPPEVIPNPLQQIVPPIISTVKLGYGALEAGAKAAADAVLRGSATQKTIAYFADKVGEAGVQGPAPWLWL